MGELRDDGSTNHQTDVSSDGDKVSAAPEENGFQTDVEGVVATSSVKRGKDEFPCFDVSSKEFFQNMNGGRKRIRFKSGTPTQQYMQKSKYSRKFYIKYTDDNGKSLVRSIK